MTTPIEDLLFVERPCPGLRGLSVEKQTLFLAPMRLMFIKYSYFNVPDSFILLLQLQATAGVGVEDVKGLLSLKCEGITFGLKNQIMAAQMAPPAAIPIRASQRRGPVFKALMPTLII